MHLKTFLKMKISSLAKLVLLLLLFTCPVKALETTDHLIGKDGAKIKIEIFSSLTCPHCAKLHLNVLPELIKNYADTEKASINLKDFPLDLPALNAAKIAKCISPKKILKYYDTIYSTQPEWVTGSNIGEINKKLKKISLEFGLNNETFEPCLNNEKNEELVLKSRIEAQKKYNINSTPTIIINNKKYNGDYTFSAISKYIEKLN